MNKTIFIFIFIILIISFSLPSCNKQTPKILSEKIKTETKKTEWLKLSRDIYEKQIYGFWLGQCIANWTGLITEMDKIGNIGEIKTGDFYTRKNWGGPDLPSIWSDGLPSDISNTIDYVIKKEGEIWGADDDTDIEYMYLHLLYTHNTSILTAEQIRDGWLKHIKSEEENYLWVSNQRAYDLMQEGVLPPETSDPKLNEHYDMIDAQLTTEIFGLLAPGRPDIALELARLPVYTTARSEAAQIAEFYIVMHSLASKVDTSLSIDKQILWMSQEARKNLPNGFYPAHMYDYVRSLYDSDIIWEQARDSIYYRYQVDQKDGYDMSSRNLYCNGCFAAGINFAASLVSLFYGEGDILETIKIGTLAGWDSDNPTATWGGLIGFMIGKNGIEKAFKSKLSNEFDIHRTRQNFPNNGIDTFDNMARKAISVIDRIVTKRMGGTIDLHNNSYLIPLNQ